MNPFEGLRRNTAINLVGAGLPLVVSLATVPVYVRVIGPERYGILLIVWALLGYFGAFDLGLSRAVAHKMAQLRQATAEQRSQLVWTGLVLGVGVGLLGGAAMVGVGYLFSDRLLDIAPDLRRDTVAGLIWLGLAVPITNAMWLLIGSLEGQERFVRANAVIVTSTVLAQAVPLCVGLLTGSGLTWMLASVTLASLFGLVMAGAMSARAVPLRRISGFDRSLAAVLARYGGWVMVTSILGPLLLIIDRLVIGAISGARAVTSYAVPYNLVSRIGIVPLSLTRSLFPRLSLLAGDAADLVQRQAVVGLLAVVTPFLVVAMFLLEPFLHIWIGEDLAPEASRVGQIILLGVFANAVASIPYTYLLARGRPSVPAKLYLLELVPYIALLLIAVRYAGIEGAAWATTARMSADAVLMGAAARLPRRAVGAVVTAWLPVALAYAVVVSAGGSSGGRAVGGIVVTGIAIIISLWLHRQIRADAGRPAAPKSGHLTGAEGL